MLNTPEFVTAELKYLANGENTPGYVASTGGGDTTEHKGNYVMHSVPIFNARNAVDEFSLDKQGFILVNHNSHVSDYYDEQDIKNTYEDEIRTLVRERTGAQRVEVFDHTRRSSSVEIQKQKKIRESASIIHNDYTAESGPNRLKDYLRDHFADRPGEADNLLGRPFAVINVWRSIDGPVLNSPLTICDASSTRSEDLVSIVREAKDRIGGIQLARYSPEHRWYYFPKMLPGEALVFKTFDSKTDGRARFTIHSSFDDKTAPADAPPRESIETRCFVFF